MQVVFGDDGGQAGVGLGLSRVVGVLHLHDLQDEIALAVVELRVLLVVGQPEGPERAGDAHGEGGHARDRRPIATDLPVQHDRTFRYPGGTLGRPFAACERYEDRPAFWSASGLATRIGAPSRKAATASTVSL